MPIDKFIKCVPKFTQLTASGKIDYFIYYLLKEENFDGVESKDVKKCFEKLDLAPYSNISNYLINHTRKGKLQKYLKRNDKYFLENSIKSKIEKEILKGSELLKDNNGKLHVDMEPAGIQYMGEAGITQECKEGILKLLQYGDKIHQANILTFSNRHGFLLTINNGDLVAIKSGFSSGYNGEGPHGFSYVLQLLDFHGSDIKEYDVSEYLLERLDSSALTQSDIETFKDSSLTKPIRWRDYIIEYIYDKKNICRIWQEFPPAIPYLIIDERIIDLALSFWDNPDEKLLTGYRRLEDILRKKSRIIEHGAKLFSQAFQKKLMWKNLDESEKNGRTNLFTGAYMAYRNPRSHREPENNSHNQLREFLLLNHLYSLESESFEIDDTPVAASFQTNN